MPSSSTRRPCLAAAAVFAILAIVIARLAVSPLAVSDLLGIAACAAASGAFATLAFTLRPPGPAELIHTAPVSQTVASPAAAPAVDIETLAARIAASVEARLAATETARRDEIVRALTSSAPAPDFALEEPASATTPPTSKPRLGRGLAALMHAPSALTTPPSSSSSQ